MPRPTMHRNRPIQPVNESALQLVEEMSYDDLYALAQQENVRGRSSMTKEELIEALS